MAAPVITVGLPVYNGDNYLEEAVNSVLTQDFADFELVIRDNASNDRTESICRHFEELDERVRYVRNPRNVGAAPNFNALVGDARGEYFKWMAHDDIIEPEFLSACLRALEEDAEAVLACPTVRFIDAQGSPLEEYISSFRTHDSDRVIRFGDTLYGHKCFEVFGLIRLPQLRETRLIAGYNNGDGVLLGHLALLGKFAVVPGSLFLSRCHGEQSMYLFGASDRDSKLDAEAYARWFDHDNSSGVSLSHNRALKDYARMVASTPMSHQDRRRCYGLVSKWTLSKWRCIAGEWKRSLYGPLGLDTTPRHLRAKSAARPGGKDST